MTPPRLPSAGDPIRASDARVSAAYIRSLYPRESADIGVRITPDGTSYFIKKKAAPRRTPASSSAPAFNWKCYNTTQGATGQVQINGGDGFVASLNGFVFNVDGNPNDTLVGGAYPQLAVTGNGVIYGYAVPETPGTASPLASGDIFYSGTLPSLDTASPATYFPFLVATISNYSVDGSGNPHFDVNNATNYGWTTMIYCGGAIQIY